MNCKAHYSTFECEDGCSNTTETSPACLVSRTESTFTEEWIATPVNNCAAMWGPTCFEARLSCTQTTTAWAYATGLLTCKFDDE